MPRPEECRYTKEHEWIFREGELLVVGVSDFAQSELGEIVYVDLKPSGQTLTAGDELGTIESVKAVAEVYAPVRGEVVEVNAGLVDTPEAINEDPMGAGWLVKMRPESADAFEGLMDHATYASYLDSAQ